MTYGSQNRLLVLFCGLQLSLKKSNGRGTDCLVKCLLKYHLTIAYTRSSCDYVATFSITVHILGSRQLLLMLL